VNIEGLVGGYTGPGGKNHSSRKKRSRSLICASFRIWTAAEALAALKAHLAKKGFGDIEVRMTGGYDPNSTPADAALIRVETEVYRKGGIDPVILPRSRRVVARLCIHRRAAPPSGGTLWSRPWKRRARSPTSTTSLNRKIRKSKEWMALSTRLSNCSTHWHKRAKKSVTEKSAERSKNFARLALLRLIKMK